MSEFRQELEDALNKITALEARIEALEMVLRAARCVLALEGIVFASDDKERPMLAQTVVRQILAGPIAALAAKEET